MKMGERKKILLAPKDVSNAATTTTTPKRKQKKANYGTATKPYSKATRCRFVFNQDNIPQHTNFSVAKLMLHVESNRS